MPSSDQLPPICDAYRFGPFEVRVGQEVLLLRGRRIRIQDLPFKMLVVLLEHPGELVTKELLQERLWGPQTFVEVDKGLYVVAAKLREALGDDANEPRFIRTVSGRGYRFVGKVDAVFDSTPSTDSSFVPLQSAITNEREPGEPVRAQSSERVHRRLHGLFLWVALALAVASVCGYLLYSYYNKPLVGEKNSIVAAGLANATGNPDLENVLSSAFQIKLQESPYLNLIPDLQFRRLVKDPDSASLQDQLHACASLDGQVLLNGQLKSHAQGYRVLLMVWRCRDGKLLASEDADAGAQSGLLPALDLAVLKVRRRLGESKKSVEQFNVPSMEATTGSLAALRAFSMGEQQRFEGRKPEAFAAYKLAVDLDPQFAIAYARLGTVYTNMGEASLGRDYYKRAFDLRDRTNDRERLYIITHYYAAYTGEIRRAIDDYELWRTLYPRDVVPANNLAIEYLVIGHPEKAVDLARTAVELDPHDPFPYATLAQAYQKAGDYKNLQILCDDPARNTTDILGFHVACFESAFAQNDEPGMQRQLQWAKGTPDEGKFLDEEASVAIFRGRLAEARRLISAAKQSALNSNLILAAAAYQLDGAVFEAELGFPAEARRNTLESLQLASGNPYEQAFAAAILALAGDTSGARSNMKEAAAQAPSDTLLNSVVLATAQAAIDLKEHNPMAAIQSLAEAEPFDFYESTGLAPAYLRGLAYLEDNNPQQAETQFQRVIDHRAADPTSLFIVLAQLELGRTFQRTGDNQNAERAFESLASAWKGADPDFPLLKQLHEYQHVATPHD